MAILHESTLSPLKSELISPWLRTCAWWDGEDERDPVGTFRLDDPAGEVGMECFLFGSAAGSTLFVPVTYRSAPLPAREESLIGLMEHSVLGTRYVYDACSDPVFAATVLDTIRWGGHQAEQRLRRADGSEVVRDPIATASGDGVPTVPAHDPAEPVRATDDTDRTIVTGPAFELTVLRRIGEAPSGPALRGTYEGGQGQVLVVVTG